MRRATEKLFETTEAMDRAYSLSYSILAGDTKSALKVTRESLNEWKVDWSAQNHRTYHKAVPNRTPNKMLFSRPALLQYIVCQQTTPLETAHEAAFLNGEGSLNEGTLLLRFIKHTVHESSHRSFNMTIGNCRILHKYDHATTRDFYGVLDQRNQKQLVEGEPDNFTYEKYRTCKMILVNSLEKRFKEFVTVVHGSRNEKRFTPNDAPSAWSQHVGDCLGRLTPWKTEHILPEEFEPTKFNIPELKCHGRDEWDSVEENRMHIIICKECFSRLAKAFGAPAPEEQVDIPQFKNVEHGPGGGSDELIASAPDLTGPQVNSIRDELERRATRRRVAVSEHLSVEVDGVEGGWLYTANNSGVRIDLNPESRQIQVFTTDAEGKLLLASLWLSLIDITPDAGWQSSMTLEGGQRLGIDIKLDSVGELQSLTALISYKEGNPLRIVTHYLEQVRGVISEQFQLETIDNHARQLQGAIQSHKTEFALGMLLVAAMLSLTLLRHSIPLGANTGAYPGRTKIVVQSAPVPRVTIAKPLDRAADDFVVELTSPRPAGNQDREQFLPLGPRSERAAFTDIYPMDPREQRFKALTDPLTLQRIYNYGPGSSEPSGSSEWLTSCAKDLAQTPFFSIFLPVETSTAERVVVSADSNDPLFRTPESPSTEEKPIGIEVADRNLSKSYRQARVTRSESYSLGTVDWDKFFFTLSAHSAHLDGGAQPFLSDRSSIKGNTSKEVGRRDLSRGRQAVDYRAEAFKQMLDLAQVYEQAKLRRTQINAEILNLFNKYNRQQGELRSLDQTAASIEISDGDTSRIKNLHAANCAKISFDRNYTTGSNTSPFRFGVKFQF